MRLISFTMSDLFFFGNQQGTLVIFQEAIGIALLKEDEFMVKRGETARWSSKQRPN